MISIRDLAQEVGFSHTTVSRALKNDPGIGASTREKIRLAAERLGYRPNALVGGITGRRSRLIAMIASDLTTESLARQMTHVSDFLRERGYPLLTLNSGNNPTQEQSCFHLAVDHRVAGLILHGTVCDSSSAHFKELIESNIPFVITKEHSPKLHVPHVYRDDQEAISQAVAEAVALGHRHFAHVAGPKETLADSIRLKCYRQALAECGMALPDSGIATSDWTAESGIHATFQLLGKNPKTTFIFAANDEVALGVYKACAKAGRRIPEDISVLGSGDMHIGKLLSPPLNTINPKLQEIATASCELLLEMINQPDFNYATRKPLSFTVPGTYLPRESIGPAPKSA